MAPVFFYGTLRHLPVLESVIGHGTEALTLTPARLVGHAVYAAGDQPFPLLLPAPDQAAEGLLVEGLGAEDLARIAYYESGFAFEVRTVEVDTTGGQQPAQVFFPGPDVGPQGALWSLEHWQAQWGALSTLAAQEVMTYRGVKSAQELAAMFPMIRNRAQARLNAAQSNMRHSPSGKGPEHIDLRSVETGYAKFFAVKDMTYRFERFDGTMSPVVDRAVFLGVDAVIVLPYDPVRDRVLLVEQMRAGPLGRGDSDLWQLEPIAGLLDAGETPQETARREAVEEASITLGALEEVAQVYPSPGESSAFFHIFVAPTDLPDALAQSETVGGAVSEGEDIRRHLFSFDQLMHMAQTGGVRNAPLMICAWWLQANRARLRGQQGGNNA